MRVILAFLALSLAASTVSFAAQPGVFVPPAGWTPSPQIQRMPIPTSWQRGAPGAGEMISIISYPLVAVGTVLGDALAQQFKNMGAKVAVTKATLCGAPASIIVAKMPAGGDVIETALESSHGGVYAISYMHPAAAVDPAAEAFMRASCPASPDAVSTLSVPSGWEQTPSMQIAGGWQGPNLGEQLIELTGPPTASLDPTRSLRLLTGMPSIPNIPGIAFRQKPGFLLCGHPAGETLVTLSMSGFSLQMDAVTTVTSTHSYMFAYATFESALDANVIAALHGFCPS